MNAIMISIHQEWCEKIASGKKTIEVRKTRPKIEPPFKCYIYETISSGLILDRKEIYRGFFGRGMVIGEFLCAEIDHYALFGTRRENTVYRKISKNGYPLPINYTPMCLSEQEFIDYGAGKMLYGLHLSNIKIYDAPMRIDTFKHWVDVGSWSHLCPMDRPPQSWCYVEESPPFEGGK